MYHLLKKTMLLTIALLGMVVFLFTPESAFAIKAIPDGGARFPPGGGDFVPEQKNVNPKVKRMWENAQIPRGGKNSLIYSPKTGRNLIYDVYAGTSDQVKKRSFYLTPTRN